MSYRIDIATQRSPQMSACTPRFESHREAFAYGSYLREEYAWITRAEIVEEPYAEPTAVWQAGHRRLRWLPAAEPLEGVDAT